MNMSSANTEFWDQLGTGQYAGPNSENLRPDLQNGFLQQQIPASSITPLGTHLLSAAATPFMQNLDNEIYEQQQLQNNSILHQNVTSSHTSSSLEPAPTIKEDPESGNGQIKAGQEEFRSQGKGSSPANTSDSSSSNTQHLTEEELYQKRKAQNRAAQRAFRERKEGKLKELAAKLDRSETEKQTLLRQLEQLKEKNAKLDIENQLLHKGDSEKGSRGSIDTIPVEHQIFDFPKNMTEFVVSLVDPRRHGADAFEVGSVDGDLVMSTGPSSSDTLSLKGMPLTNQSYIHENEVVLTVSAVWDYLNVFSANNEDLELDIPEIMSRLRGTEVCHGHGPAYPLRIVDEVIRSSIK